MRRDCRNELDHAVSVIWALDGDFTNARGTTRIVLGSRHWERGRYAKTPSFVRDKVHVISFCDSCSLGR